MPDANTDIRETLNDFFRAVEAMQLDRVATFFDEDAQMFSPLGTYPARLDGRENLPHGMSDFRPDAIARNQSDGIRHNLL